MTLRTPRGVRFLKGAERTLVFEGILTLSDAVHDLGDGLTSFIRTLQSLKILSR